MIEKSDRLAHVHSDIRGPLYVEALRMQAQGIPVLKLNTGNPGKRPAVSCVPGGQGGALL